MNDWSARDLQRAEMAVGLGPSKGKDFATSLGPVLVTVDELDGSGLEMVARVNGEERSRGNSRDMHHRGRRSSRTQRGTRGSCRGTCLVPGTVGSGCILEHGDGRWLRPGDVVELEIEGIGVLRNTVGPVAQSLTCPKGHRTGTRVLLPAASIVLAVVHAWCNEIVPTHVTTNPHPPATTIVLDFDGTITEDDLLDRIAREFGDPAVYEEVEQGSRRNGSRSRSASPASTSP